MTTSVLDKSTLKTKAQFPLILRTRLDHFLIFGGNFVWMFITLCFFLTGTPVLRSSPSGIFWPFGLVVAGSLL